MRVNVVVEPKVCSEYTLCRLDWGGIFLVVFGRSFRHYFLYLNFGLFGLGGDQLICLGNL